ncbi:MAG: XisI protein [Lyngbya sp.]|nr:XisI protein [Lyngbya sp.]
MDTQKSNRELIQNIIIDYTKVPYAYGEIEFETVFDREQDRYLLMLVGRDGDRRVHGCLIHVDIINGKFWIQRDGTEQGIATDLLEAGIPKDKIVLAFHPPEIREAGEFAVL